MRYEKWYDFSLETKSDCTRNNNRNFEFLLLKTSFKYESFSINSKKKEQEKAVICWIRSIWHEKPNIYILLNKCMIV